MKVFLPFLQKETIFENLQKEVTITINTPNNVNPCFYEKYNNFQYGFLLKTLHNAYVSEEKKIRFQRVYLVFKKND